MHIQLFLSNRTTSYNERSTTQHQKLSVPNLRRNCLAAVGTFFRRRKVSSANCAKVRTLHSHEKLFWCHYFVSGLVFSKLKTMRGWSLLQKLLMWDSRWFMLTWAFVEITTESIPLAQKQILFEKSFHLTCGEFSRATSYSSSICCVELEPPPPFVCDSCH